MRRPRIKRTIEKIATPEGDVYLLWFREDRDDIRIAQPNEEERLLLFAVDGSRTLEQLQAEFGEQAVNDLIAQLQELEMVEDAADDELLAPGEQERFDRQLLYFSDIGSTELPPSLCQERLREAKVAVLGVGGLGGWSAWALACIGIGEMWLVDGDVVELSNLNRQTLYTEADIGQLKVERAAERLRAFNSGCKITATAKRLESEADISEFIAGSDVVVDAADWPAHDIEEWCNAACFKAGIPYIVMSHIPPLTRVGPLYVPGVTGCLTCQAIGFRREYPLFDVMVEQQRAKPSTAATLGPACAMIGGQVALEVMHLLTGLARPTTQGVGYMYDLRTMEAKREPVVPEPECPVCGHLEHEEPTSEGGKGTDE